MIEDILDSSPEFHQDPITIESIYGYKCIKIRDAYTHPYFAPYANTFYPTGEFRHPKANEWFISTGFSPMRDECALSHPRIILRERKKAKKYRLLTGIPALIEVGKKYATIAWRNDDLCYRIGTESQEAGNLIGLEVEEYGYSDLSVEFRNLFS